MLLSIALLASRAGAALPSDGMLRPYQQERYSMGTMFRIVVYHASAATAGRAIDKAMSEIVRLDAVMSHYQPDSGLSRLNRQGHHGAIPVEASLYEIIQESLTLSRHSAGQFDITVAPLLRAWKGAHEAGRHPSADEIRDAGRCVGYQQVELVPPDRVRLRSDCVELDLGGIGKGYAVDRALAVLQSEGVRAGLVNAGGSTIGAIGAPPGEPGWPVRLAAAGPSGSRTLVLRDNSMSTSQQRLRPWTLDSSTFGEIIDPRRGAPTRERAAVTVVATRATLSDGLSTALLLMSPTDAQPLLEQFPGTAALWTSPAGEVQAAHGDAGLWLASRR